MGFFNWFGRAMREEFHHLRLVVDRVQKRRVMDRKRFWSKPLRGDDRGFENICHGATLPCDHIERNP